MLPTILFGSRHPGHEEPEHEREARQDQENRRHVRTTRRRKMTHDEIAARACFIHLTDGVGDAVQSWLRAESESMAA